MLYPQFRNRDGSRLPASQTAVLEWVAWLGGAKRLQPKTIKSYITHLWSAHVDAGLPFSACESPMLQHRIRGIKRYMGEHERSPKLPITRDVLAHILASATHPNLSGRLNFKAATTTAFSGFLRCGEFTMHSGRNFDPSIHLTRSSVEFVPSFVTPSHVVLTMLASKTDPFRKGIAITIASAPGARTCTVAALKSLFEYIKRPPESPLFTQDDGAPLSRNSFIGLLMSG